MTEAPLDKVRAAGLVIGSHEEGVFSDGRASPWPLHLEGNMTICFQEDPPLRAAVSSSLQL